MKNGENRSDLIRFNSRQQSEPIGNQVLNPNQSELGLIQTKILIKINPNHSDLGFIRIDPDWKLCLNQSELELFRIDLDWKLGFGMNWIHSDCCLGLIRIRSDRFFTVFHQLQNVFRIGSEWFALAQIQISEWIGIVLIGSEWIPIQYFRQGYTAWNFI